MRIWLKIRVFLVMVKFVSAYVERDKKISKKFDFCLQLYAEMVDFSSLDGCLSSFENGYLILDARESALTD